MSSIRSYILERLPDGNISASDNLNCCCPFHNDGSPSFSISLETGLFICRSASCGVQGSFPKFVKLIEGISWKETFKKLKKYSINVSINDLLNEKDDIKPKKPKKLVNDFPIEPFIEDLKVVPYLKDRGLGKVVIDSFGLKFGKLGEFDNLDISNTIVIPIFDIDGVYKTFQVRRLGEGKSRWLNPSDSPIHNYLYGGWIEFHPGNLFIVEGASDVWNLYSHGLQSVGLFTKECSFSQFNRLTTILEYYDLSPVVCLDGDAKKYSKRLFNDLTASGFEVKLVLLEDHEDPGCLNSDRIEEILGGLNGY